MSEEHDIMEDVLGTGGFTPPAQDAHGKPTTSSILMGGSPKVETSQSLIGWAYDATVDYATNKVNGEIEHYNKVGGWEYAKEAGIGALERVDGVVRTTANAITFGLADKLEAGTEAVVTGESYEDRLKLQHQADKDFAEKYPVLNFVGEAAGLGVQVALGAGLIRGGISAAATTAPRLAAAAETTAGSLAIETAAGTATGVVGAAVHGNDMAKHGMLVGGATLLAGAVPVVGRSLVGGIKKLAGVSTTETALVATAEGVAARAEVSAVADLAGTAAKVESREAVGAATAATEGGAARAGVASVDDAVGAAVTKTEAKAVVAEAEGVTAKSMVADAEGAAIKAEAKGAVGGAGEKTAVASEEGWFARWTRRGDTALDEMSQLGVGIGDMMRMGNTAMLMMGALTMVMEMIGLDPKNVKEMVTGIGKHFLPESMQGVSDEAMGAMFDVSKERYGSMDKLVKGMMGDEGTDVASVLGMGEPDAGKSGGLLEMFVPKQQKTPTAQPG